MRVDHVENYVMHFYVVLPGGSHSKQEEDSYFHFLQLFWNSWKYLKNCYSKVWIITKCIKFHVDSQEWLKMPFLYNHTTDFPALLSSHTEPFSQEYIKRNRIWLLQRKLLSYVENIHYLQLYATAASLHEMLFAMFSSHIDILSQLNVNTAVVRAKTL